MKLALCFILLLYFPSAHASDWGEKDKQLHVAWSTMIGSGSYLGLGFINYSGNKLLVSSSLCLAIGTLKEVSDINSSGFDPKDLGFSAIGCAIGIYSVHSAISFWHPEEDTYGIQIKKVF